MQSVDIQHFIAINFLSSNQNYLVEIDKQKDMLLGNKIKELRDQYEVLQRQLAAYLEIDTPMFSKIERGDSRAKRNQVIQLAKYFHINENELLILWLADKVMDALEGENELSLDAIEVVKSNMKRNL